jgi:phosphate acyltransferase
MRIALDAMGGDFAPKATVEGALIVAKELPPDVEIWLIGQEEAIKTALSAHGETPVNIKIVHAEEVIEMGEHPTKALQQKQKSSIAIGYYLLKEGKIDAFCGAGNTGAMHVGAIFSVKPIEGILRPSLISHVPKVDGTVGVILDVGANTDCKPEMLHQFGQLGSIYCQNILDIENPRIALMNLGEEEGKGDLHTQAAYQLLKANTSLNFIGNVEGRDIFTNKADVIVCDGFIGNVVLKMAESVYDIAAGRNINDGFFNQLNYEAIGGSPILGVNGNAVIGHGISSSQAIRNMILIARKMAQSNLNTKIKSALLANA